MTKTLTLDSSLLAEMFFENTVLWGITSSLHGYDLCHVLNVALRLQLVRRIDMDVKVMVDNKPKGKQLLPDLFSELSPIASSVEYPIYYQQLPFCETEVYVYVNKKDGNILMPSVKNADYLMLIRGGNYFPHLVKLDQYIGQIRKIDALQKIPLTNLKGKEYLIM